MSKDVQFNLRIPMELKECVVDAAKESGRSINAEAQYRLEQSFKEPTRVADTFEYSSVLNALQKQGREMRALRLMLENQQNNQPK